EQERALADAWIAADQDQRAAHHAPAQHPIELVDAGADAVVPLHRDVLEWARRGGRRSGAARRALRGRPLLDELHPGAARAPAVRARPGLGAREPALLTAVDASVAWRHRRSFPCCCCCLGCGSSIST